LFLAICYHYWCCGFESRSGRGVQQYLIKFVSDLWQVGGNLFNILSTYLYLSNKIKCDICSAYSMLISAANDQVWFYLVLYIELLKQHVKLYTKSIAVIIYRLMHRLFYINPGIIQTLSYQLLIASPADIGRGMIRKYICGINLQIIFFLDDKSP
jgi:hypothetical protein